MATSQKPIIDLTPLLTPQTDFGVIVKQAFESQPDHAPRVDLLFVRFNEAVPDDDGLAEVVCHQVVNYAIPKRKLSHILDQLKSNPTDMSIASKLTTEARRAFIAYKNNDLGKPQSRYSEIGEVIAFCLASHYLSAGQVAAKMALKTSSEMPVFGIDGIHVHSESDGTLTVFFLESKMVDDPESGCKQYSQSAASFESNRKTKLNEYRIARDLSNLDMLEAAARESALEYFNPYSDQYAKVRERHVGVVIYSDPGYAKKLKVTDKMPIDSHEKKFIERYARLHPRFSAVIGKALKKEGVELGKCRTFFLAVPSVDRLKELFAKEMANEHIR